MEGRFLREGTAVYQWLKHADVSQRPTQYCKAIILQLKKIRKEKNISQFSPCVSITLRIPCRDLPTTQKVSCELNTLPTPFPWSLWPSHRGHLAVPGTRQAHSFSGSLLWFCPQPSPSLAPAFTYSVHHPPGSLINVTSS